MDISHDSKLIVTCSSDKNVKIWDLDFGDCHKSLFAHDESVMQVAFERNDTREGEGKPKGHGSSSREGKERAMPKEEYIGPLVRFNSIKPP